MLHFDRVGTEQEGFCDGCGDEPILADELAFIDPWQGTAYHHPSCAVMAGYSTKEVNTAMIQYQAQVGRATVRFY